MKKFLVLYSGGKAPSTPQEGEASTKAWMAWFGKLGKVVVEAGAPFSRILDGQLFGGPKRGRGKHLKRLQPAPG